MSDSTCDDPREQAHRLIGHAALSGWLTASAASFSLPLAYIMKRARRQGRILIALSLAKTAHSVFCAQIATQKTPKFLLIVNFMPNLSDAFLLRLLSKRPPLFGAVCFFEADRGGVNWNRISSMWTGFLFALGAIQLGFCHVQMRCWIISVHILMLLSVRIYWRARKISRMHSSGLVTFEIERPRYLIDELANENRIIIIFLAN